MTGGWPIPPTLRRVVIGAYMIAVVVMAVVTKMMMTMKMMTTITMMTTMNSDTRRPVQAARQVAQIGGGIHWRSSACWHGKKKRSRGSGYVIGFLTDRRVLYASAGKYCGGPHKGQTRFREQRLCITS